MNVLRALLILSLVSVTLSCGGGSSKEDPVALCKQGCTKTIDLCASDLGVDPATFRAFCESACTSSMGSNGMMCTNSNAIISAYKTCQSETTCETYMTCLNGIPECQGGGSTGTGGASGTGTGGASGGGSGGRSGGTGGSSGGGTGGSSGGGTGGSSGTGATCADVLACCNAATNPTIKGLCMLQYDAIKNAGDATCAMYLTAEIKATYCP